MAYMSSSIWSVTLSPSRMMISKWSLIRTRRSVDAYPDFLATLPIFGINA